MRRPLDLVGVDRFSVYGAGGNGMDGGYFYGREGVREYWTRRWGIVGPHVEPRSVDEDGRVVVEVHQVVRHVYVVEDGLLWSMETQEAQA